MLVLLPPSEGKAEPGAGEPITLDSLAFAAPLGERREEVLAALDPDPQLREAPAAPAAEVNAGVRCGSRSRRSSWRCGPIV
jgi:hypothetical protein